MNIPYYLTNAIFYADSIVNETVANLNGLHGDLAPAYIRAASEIYAADKIAMALETLAGSNSDIAHALENLAHVAGSAAGELVTLVDRGARL